MKMQRISSKTTKSSKPKTKKSINESNAKSNANYLSNRSKKCNTITSASNTSSASNNKNKKRKKCIKSEKSKPVKSFNRRKMHKSGSSSTSPTSPRAKSKASATTTAISISCEDDINEMPILTPEVPFDSDIDNDLIGNNSLKIPSIDVNLVDLVPPVLSPALDQESKANTDCEKSKNKRKVKYDLFKDDDELDSSLYRLSDKNSDNNEFDRNVTKKVKPNVKTTLKKSTKVNKIVKSSNKFLQKSIQKSIQKSKGKLYSSNSFTNISSNKMRNYNSNNNNNNNESNVWSVDCDHTMTTSTNTSLSIEQPFIKYSNKMERKFSTNQMDCAQSESILVNNDFEDSVKLMKQKSSKKPKLGFNSQSDEMSSKGTNESLFKDLIGVQKPEAEIDEIEGIVFQSFETEESLNLFSRFETLEKDQERGQSSSVKYKIKSFKSGKVIFPTKTKDITKIKGWREKLFSSIDDKQSKRSICKPLENSTLHENICNSLIFNPTTAQTSKGSKSAFVSDILDGYLKNKSDLKLNYLSPDLAPPPDDSPIFSASVLKMPDSTNNESMPPPPNSSSPNKRKGNFGRSKGLKNKLSLKMDFSDSMDFLDETSNSEQFVPKLAIIRETLWSEAALSDDHLNLIYEEYVDLTYHEMQMMKKYNPPSFIMDDHYARYALSALQYEERVQFANDSNDNSDDVLMAVGLAPKKKELSPVKETKITGRYRKDREADLAKIIAMGNRSKRQIRLPSRFHESSLLMGNQWVIPDYDQKGKTGKRRLQQEQKRLQELHQRQLELEQRNQLTHLSEQISSTNDDSQLAISLNKNQLNYCKNQRLFKTKVRPFSIPVPNEYPLKIPQQHLQMMRNRKILSKSINKNEKLGNKSLKSTYPLATQTSDEKKQVPLSAKAAASASQRAVVNQLFHKLYDTISPEEQTMFSRNGKINKLEVIKEAIVIIEKLNKRDQQLCYIRKLLSMWNHKLQLCSKVAQKDMKPEAYKVVNEVMNTYRSSMCYKVGEALEAKRKEFQQKRLQLLASQKSANTSQIINIPTTSISNTTNQFKTPKPVTQRLILPKLSPVYKNITPKAETVVSPSSNSNNYPKLITPDLHQRTVSEYSIDNDFLSREGSLLKPPILTTRPTVLKPFMLQSPEGGQPIKSVTGPIINVPNISRIKSMTKSINICNTTTPSLAGSNKSQISNSNISQSLINSNARLKSPLNSIPVTGTCSSKVDSESPSGEKRNIMMGINAFIPITTSSNTTSVTSSSNVSTSNSQSRPQNVFSPHAYAGKSVIITSETPLANEDLSKIVASIAANPDNFKKVPVRLSNGLATLTIPGPIEIPKKPANYTSTNSSSGTTPQSKSCSSSMIIRAKGPNNTNNSDLSDDSKSQKKKNNQFCGSNQSSSLTLNNVSAKPNILQKQSLMPKLNAVHSQSNDNELNCDKSGKTDSKANNSH